MNAVHYEVWERCTAFVARVCAGRDASHGLAHMRKVTEQALLLYLMDASADTTTHAERAGMLYRILLVAMLHDVADHKYDRDGTLFQQVEAFVEAEAATLMSRVRDGSSAALAIPLPCSATATDAVTQVKRLFLTVLDAISYSKENARGMRWFVPVLSCGAADAAAAPSSSPSSSWVAVRDYVSDADKLEAIGAEGLRRCYEYTCERFREAAAMERKAAAEDVSAALSDTAAVSRVERYVEGVMLRDVVTHFHEKLNRLLPEFIVTKAGRYLGTPRHAEMAALLKEWEAHGPPPVTVYWRNVATEYVMSE